MAVPRVFINYRVEDTGATASALCRDLERVFGREHVFLDHERLSGGDSWPHRLQEEVAASSVLLSLIGPKWLSSQDSRTGDRRLNLPGDWVRRELETALQSRTAIVPVLIDETPPIPEDALHTVSSIERVATLHCVKLRRKEWAADVENLVKLLCDKHGFQRTGARPATDDIRLRLVIDRASPLVVRKRGAAVAYGTVTLAQGSVAYGMGMILQITLENLSNVPVVVPTVDLVVIDREEVPSEAGSYPELPTSGAHLEMPSSVRSKPVEVLQQHSPGARIPVTTTRLFLGPASTAACCHTLNFEVIARAPGLWKLQVAAGAVDVEQKSREREAVCSPVWIVRN